jgi:hypothetical protein
MQNNEVHDISTCLDAHGHVILTYMHTVNEFTSLLVTFKRYKVPF